MNHSFLTVRRGEVYDFVVPGSPHWIDLIVYVDADGYSNAYMNLFAKNKRLHAARWFALCGMIGDDERSAFVIGKRLAGKPMDEAGELTFFANDGRHAYWNNFGLVSIIVTRIR